MAARAGGKLLYEALATEKNRGKLPGPEAFDSFRSDPPGRRRLVPGLDMHNPDPAKAVRWGDPTYDEMMIGWIEYTVPIDGKPN